jgi:hypothetical protein
MTYITHEEFVEKMIGLNAEFSLAIYKEDCQEIERLSIKIGKFVKRYLDGRKLYIEI